MDPSKQSSSVGSSLPTQGPTTAIPPGGDSSLPVGRSTQGQEVTLTQRQPSIPEAPSSSIHDQRPTHETFQNVSETEVTPQSSSLWNWTKSLFTGKTVDTTVATPKVPSDTEKQSETKAVSSRTVEETRTTTTTQDSGWRAFIPNWMPGAVSTVEGQEYIPSADRPIANKEGFFTWALKKATTKGVSLANWASGGRLQTKAESVGSSQARQFLESKAKTTFPNLSDDAFKALLGQLTALISDTISESSTPRDIYIPEIKIDVGMPDPVRVRNLKLRAYPVELHENCALIKSQELKRSIKIEDLECFVDIPRPDQGPAELQILMKEGVATLGTNLHKVLNNINAWDVAKAATWTGFKNLPLDMDNTAIQVETPKLTVKFDKLNSASTFIPDELVPLDQPGLMAFDSGEAVLEDIVLSRPLSLKKASNQSTIVQCGGFHLSNVRTRECLVDLRKVDVNDLDDKLSGSATADFSLDLGKVKHFPEVPKAVKYLKGIHLDCKVELDIVEGEIDVASIKKGLTIKRGRKLSPKSWFVTWVINSILGSEKTRIYKDADGNNRIDIGFATSFKGFSVSPVFGWIANKLAGNRLSDLPLPGTMAVGREGSDGKVIGTNIISTLVTGILQGWFMAPAQVHVVRKDHEVLL